MTGKGCEMPKRGPEADAPRFVAGCKYMESQRKRRTVEEARKAEQKNDEPQRKVGLISPAMGLVSLKYVATVR